MKRRVTTFVLAVAATAALLVPAGAGAGPSASASAEPLVRYLTKGKIKVSKRMEYRLVCSADCSVTASTTLVLKGPNLGPISSAGQFPAGQIIEVFLKPNKAARNAIRASGNAAKLRTKIGATAVATGETDSDSRTYRFK